MCNYLKVDYYKIYSIFTSLNSFVALDHTHVSKETNIDDLILLKSALKVLSNVEKKVISEAYLKDKSQSEIASITGLSQPSISRLLKRSEEKIRNYVSC